MQHGQFSITQKLMQATEDKSQGFWVEQ